MTEREWNQCESPYRMLREVGGVSARKMRLFGIACCRRIWHLMPEGDARRAVEVAEQMVDAEAAPQEAAELRERLKAEHLATYETASGSKEAQVRFWSQAAARGTLQDPEAYVQRAPIRPGDADLRNVWNSAGSAVGHFHDGDFPPELDAEHTAQTALLREVLGNPFAPVTFDAGWRTPAVVELARTVYDGAFERLPELGEALRNVGCNDHEVLTHCKSAEPHVRGCWVIDLVLEKS